MPETTTTKKTGTSTGTDLLNGITSDGKANKALGEAREFEISARKLEMEWETAKRRVADRFVPQIEDLRAKKAAILKKVLPWFDIQRKPEVLAAPGVNHIALVCGAIVHFPRARDSISPKRGFDDLKIIAAIEQHQDLDAAELVRTKKTIVWAQVNKLDKALLGQIGLVRHLGEHQPKIELNIPSGF